MQVLSDGRTHVAVQGKHVVAAGSADTKGPMLILSADNEGVLRVLYSTENGDGAKDGKTTALAITNAGDRMVISEPVGNQVGIFAVPSCEIVRLAHRTEAKARAICFSGDGKQM